MTKIICKLFGYPKIYEDKKEIFLPSGKLTAFFYYILLKKVVSRDEVAGMFWASSNEQNAKISLRNALHKIRKNRIRKLSRLFDKLDFYCLFKNAYKNSWFLNKLL